MITALATDHLPSHGPSIAVELKDGRAELGIVELRSPHRHAYHELLWNRTGTGLHRIDGQAHPIRPGTLTIVGRGQVHVLEQARNLSGAIVRFGDEVLSDRGLGGNLPAWLLDPDGPRTIGVPLPDRAPLEHMLILLAAEARRPMDRVGLALQCHLLSSLLLLLHRWQAQAEQPGDAAQDGELYRRFLDLLERDFTRHHDAMHYSDVLRVPPASLSHMLRRRRGQTTKELIAGRVLLEAARLLRFSDQSVGEIAFATGFADPFYFSRAFKRRYLLAPLSYRARHRGTVAAPQAATPSADAA